MGIADSFKEMADKAVDKLGGSDKAKEAVETAGDKVDERTGGKYAGHVDKGQEMARDYLERNRDDRTA
ncbi:antitoxin [Polymorphospora sp. NPDC051019]|uniref:antitoxin n=1 Tax=unclassified Polymorphospora TaxID=2685497 RepID=UPI0033DF814C